MAVWSAHIGKIKSGLLLFDTLSFIRHALTLASAVNRKDLLGTILADGSIWRETGPKNCLVERYRADAAPESCEIDILNPFVSFTLF